MDVATKQVVRNGTFDTTFPNINIILYAGGNIFDADTSGTGWEFVGGAWPDTALPASPNGQFITNLSGSVCLIDINENAWVISTGGYTVNAVFAPDPGVDLLLYYNGRIYKSTSNTNWMSALVINTGISRIINWTVIAGDPRLVPPAPPAPPLAPPVASPPPPQSVPFTLGSLSGGDLSLLNLPIAGPIPALANRISLANTLLSVMGGLSGSITNYSPGGLFRNFALAQGSELERQGIISSVSVTQNIAYSLMNVFDISAASAIPAQGIAEFSSPGFSSPVVISQGTIIQSSTGIQFLTTKAAILAANDQVILVPIQALIGGIGGNLPANAINQVLTGLSLPLLVTNPQATTGGVNQQSIGVALADLSAKIASLNLDSPVSIANACIGVTVPDTNESCVFSTVAEQWIYQIATSGSIRGFLPTPGFQVFIDNGAGTASPALVANVKSTIDGSSITGAKGYRPAGVPYTVSATVPVLANLTISGTTSVSGNATIASGLIQTAITDYFGGLQFGQPAYASELSAQLVNSALGLLNSLTVYLYYSNNLNTQVTIVTGGAQNRILLSPDNPQINVVGDPTADQFRLATTPIPVGPPPAPPPSPPSNVNLILDCSDFTAVEWSLIGGATILSQQVTDPLGGMPTPSPTPTPTPTPTPSPTPTPTPTPAPAAATYGGGTLTLAAVGPQPNVDSTILVAAAGAGAFTLVENASFGPNNPEGVTVPDRTELVKHYGLTNGESLAWNFTNSAGPGTTNQGDAAYWGQNAFGWATCPEDPAPTSTLNGVTVGGRTGGSGRFYVYRTTAPGHDFTTDPTCMIMWNRPWEAGNVPTGAPTNVNSVGSGYMATLFNKILYHSPIFTGHDLLMEHRWQIVPAAGKTVTPYAIIGMPDFFFSNQSASGTNTVNGEIDFIEWEAQNNGTFPAWMTGKHIYMNGTWLNTGNQAVGWADDNLMVGFPQMTMTHYFSKTGVYNSWLTIGGTTHTWTSGNFSGSTGTAGLWNNNNSPVEMQMYMGYREPNTPMSSASGLILDPSYFPMGMKIWYSRFWMR